MSHQQTMSGEDWISFTNDHHFALDGVPMKVNDKYLPKKIVQDDLSNLRFDRSKSKVLYTSEPYDFENELGFLKYHDAYVLSKEQEKTHWQQAAEAEAKKQAAETQAKKQLQAKSVIATNGASTSSTTNIARSSAATNAVVTATSLALGGILTPERASPITISQPNSQPPISNIQLKDFENSSDDPFETAELGTLDDMAELKMVLGNTNPSTSSTTNVVSSGPSYHAPNTNPFLPNVSSQNPFRTDLRMERTSEDGSANSDPDTTTEDYCNILSLKDDPGTGTNYENLSSVAFSKSVKQQDSMSSSIPSLNRAPLPSPRITSPTSKHPEELALSTSNHGKPEVAAKPAVKPKPSVKQKPNLARVGAEYVGQTHTASTSGSQPHISAKLDAIFAKQSGPKLLLTRPPKLSTGQVEQEHDVEYSTIDDGYYEDVDDNTYEPIDEFRSPKSKFIPSRPAPSKPSSHKPAVSKSIAPPVKTKPSNTAAKEFKNSTAPVIGVSNSLYGCISSENVYATIGPAEPIQASTSEHDDLIELLTSMGFNRAQIDAAITHIGNNRDKVVDHLVTLDNFSKSQGVTWQVAHEALLLYPSSQDKAKSYTELCGQLLEFGFQADAIKEALKKSDLNRERALDILCSS